MTVSTGGGPLLIAVSNSTAQLVPALGGTGNTVFIMNMDTVANLYIGSSAGITAANALQLPPGASSVEDATHTIYAFTDSQAPPIMVQVSPGTSEYNLSPEQVLTDISIAELAVAIAQAIATSGVPLLAAPIPMYSTVISGSSGSPGHFGGTFTGNWTSQGQADAAVSSFNSAVGRTCTAAKLYYQQGQFPQTYGINEKQLHDEGLAAYVCFKPAFNPPVASDTTAMIATLAFLQSKGITIAGVILGQEPEDWYASHGGPPAVEYVAMVQFHYPGLHTAGYRVGMDHAGSRQGQWSQFDPGAGYQDFVMVDLYGPTWLANGGVNGTVWSGVMALGQTYNIPWGIAEFDTSNMKSALNQTDGTNYLQSINNQFIAGQQAGTSFEAAIWYYGYGANVSPPMQVGDYRAPLLAAINDTITAPSAPPTINPGGQQTVTPLNPPASNGNVAPANTLSYDSLLQITAGAGSTNPFAKVTVSWEYLASNGGVNKMRIDQWLVPMGVSTSGGAFIYGQGPQHGQYVRIQIQNLDTVACTYQFQMNALSREIPLHDWRWDPASSPTIPNFPRANAADGNTLYEVVNGQNVSPSTTSTWLFGMFAGQAYMNFRVTGAAGNQTVIVRVNPVPTSDFTNAAQYAVYLPGTGVAGNQATLLVAMPRGPVLVSVTNNDTNTIQFTAVKVPIEVIS